MRDLEGYALFKRKVKQLTGIDLEAYQPAQMERRLNTMMARVGVGDYVEYARLLAKDAQRLEEFRDFITINVSEFFRNPEKFEELEERFIPEIIASNPRPRIWSAGCSNGAEAYSLAIILADQGFCLPGLILATDVDASMIRRAKVGAYEAKDLKNVSERRIRKYFSRDGDLYVIRPEIRSMVTYRTHDLLLGGFERDFDLILCRNVAIYFIERYKQMLYTGLSSSLKPGGILFVGGSECILAPAQFGLERMSPLFYRRQLIEHRGPESSTRVLIHDDPCRPG